MKIRPMVAEDLPAVQALHGASGYDFKFPDLDSPLIEVAHVVVDSTGQPIAVCVAKRAPEIVLAMRKSDHPTVRLRALVLIHEAMTKELMSLGYKEANCFLPPELERGYGRHLQRLFGWKPSWKAYTLRK